MTGDDIGSVQMNSLLGEETVFLRLATKFFNLFSTVHQNYIIGVALILVAFWCVGVVVYTWVNAMQVSPRLSHG